MKFFIYTDASFSKKHLLGVAGFLIFSDEEGHRSGNISSAVLKTVALKEKNNNRAELMSVILALQYCIDKNEVISEVNLYTDSKSVTNLIARKKRLQLSGYKSKRNNTMLSGADLYKIFFEIHEKLNPEIHWVQGHCRKDEQDFIQKNFSCVDRLVRKKLRELLDPLNKK